MMCQDFYTVVQQVLNKTELLTADASEQKSPFHSLIQNCTLLMPVSTSLPCTQ